MDSHSIATAKGEILLESLLQQGLAVTHDCGGKLACTSCLVVVREGTEHLSAISEDELDMLDRASTTAPGARLSCQAVSAGGKVLVELPKASVPGRVAASSPVSVSERAATYLAAQLARHPGALAVRLAVERSGCSGLGYRVDPVHSIGERDEVFETGGVRIAVDPLSLPYVQGTRIDLVQEGLARRLRYENPNVRQSCGCGESFGV